MVNAFLATLAGSLATGGSEPEAFLSNITTLTGETITTANFSTWGRGILTIDPLSSANIEFDSFTAIDASGIGCTGLIRGLSALGNSVVTANKKYHPVGTQVIIAFGIHNVLDMKAYIDGAVGGALGTATNTTSGSTKMSLNMGALPRAKSVLVSQQSSPNMTLLVNAFARASRGLTINFAGGNTPSMTAPVSNPRYDLVVYSTVTLNVLVRTGSEGVSPTIPTPTAGDIVLCSVYHRVGETTLIEQDISPNTQGYIASWYEPDTYNSATVVTNDLVTNGGADQSQLISSGIQPVGQSNLHGDASILAQRFVPSVPHISGVSFLKLPDTGTFTGTVVVSLQADSSGSASGTALASYTITNAAWLLLGATFSLGSSAISGNLITVASMTGLIVTGQPITANAVGGITGLVAGGFYYAYVASSTTLGFATSAANAAAGTLITITGTPSSATITPYPIVNVVFSSEYESMVDSSPYWMVISPSTSDNSNHPNLGINTAGGYASGVLKYNNSADGWVTVPTSILWFTSNEGVVSKIIETSTNGIVPMSLSRYGLIFVNTLNISGGVATSDTIINSIQIPAGWFTPFSGIKINISGGFVGRTSQSDAVTLKVKLNGNSFISVPVIGGNGSSAAGTVAFNANIIILNNGALNYQEVYAYGSGISTNGSSASSISAITVNFASVFVPVATTAAVDTSTTGILSVTYACTNSSDSFFGGQFTIEKIA